jgi:hypothetical protein
MQPEIKIIDADYHRNGCCGWGFYAVIFESKEDGLMVASLFDKPGYCSVYNIKCLSDKNIKFGSGNSWRGDVFESVLRPAVKAFLKEQMN